MCESSAGSAAGGFITAPRGARLPVRTTSPSALHERVGSAADDVGVEHLRAGDVLGERLPVHVERRAVEQVAQLGEQRAQPAGVEEVLHEVLPRRADVREHGRAPRDRVEAREVEREAGAPRHRDEVHDGVARAAEREHGDDRVVERRIAEDVARLEVLPDHVDDASPGERCHLRVPRVGGRDGREAGQHEAQHLRGARHRRRRAHRHAVARRARDAVLDPRPLCLRDVAAAQLGPVLPRVGAAAEDDAVPVAAQHRTGGEVDRRQVHRDRAHEQRRRRLVAAAHEDAAVGGIRAEDLLRLHREQIAIEHRRRLLERLGERHRRDLDREAPRLPDAALHLLDALLEVAVAGIDVAPRVDDRDHRLAAIIVRRVAHLRGARAMPERPEVVHAVPAVAAQLLGRATTTLAHDGASCASCWRSVTAAARTGPRCDSGRLESIGSIGPMSAMPASVTASQELIGLHFIIGTFFSGLIVYKEIIRKQNFERVYGIISAITFGFFAPIFFAIVGINVQIDLIVKVIPLFLLLTAVAILSKVGASYLGSRLARFSKDESFAIAFLMNGRGMVELVIATIGFGLGLIDITLFSIAVLIGFITTIMAPVFSRRYVTKIKSKTLAT